MLSESADDLGLSEQNIISDFIALLLILVLLVHLGEVALQCLLRVVLSLLGFKPINVRDVPGGHISPAFLINF